MALAPVSSLAADSFDPELWADTTTRELLAVQAQSRKLGAEERSERVEDHLRNRIAGVTEAQRRQCLQALAARFPVVNAGSAFGNGHGVNGDSAQPVRPQTAEEWADGFETMKENFSPEQQKQFVDKLRAAGWIPAGAAPAIGGVPVPQSVEALLPKDANLIDTARVGQLLEMFFEATRSLDGSFRKVWEGIADFAHTDDHGWPHNTLEDTIRKFLAGDQDVPRVMLRNRVEFTTKLIPAVLVAVKESWDTMEAAVNKCLPDEIQKLVKKSTFGYETNCWKEYLKAVADLQPDDRVREFFEIIVKNALARIRRERKDM